MAQLDKIKLLNFFAERNINSLFHANTLQTSAVFLKHNALVSRAQVERTEEIQTPQNTDENDKKFNIYDKIFLDFCCITNRRKSPNYYGPITFELNLNDVLNDPDLEFIQIIQKFKKR